MRSRNYFIPEVKVVGKVSLFPVLSKIIFRKTNWHLGADLGSWQSLTKGSREEILRVCLPEHSVLFGIACWALVWKWPLDGKWIYLKRERKRWQIKRTASSLLARDRRWCTTRWTLSPYLWSTQPCCVLSAGPPSSRSQPAGCGGKADSALVLSLLLRCWWEPRPGAAALLTAAPSLAFPSCFLLCLIYRKRSAASQSLPLLCN